MNKWEVYQCLSPGGRRQWCAMTRADYWSDRYFDTWDEAIEYADRRARTVEVNLLNVFDPLPFAPSFYDREAGYAVECGRFYLVPGNKTEDHVAVLCTDNSEKKIYYGEALKLAQGVLSFAASQQARIINEQGQEGSGRG